MGVFYSKMEQKWAKSDENWLKYDVVGIFFFFIHYNKKKSMIRFFNKKQKKQKTNKHINEKTHRHCRQSIQKSKLNKHRATPPCARDEKRRRRRHLEQPALLLGRRGVVEPRHAALGLERWSRRPHKHSSHQVCQPKCF
eukprot:TRINITY_DN2445_c0_g1_i2.p1 TRINITY_DN2445_c0_g1~~TRINITY_DN2445_c0_g1_i2.p1  ORF type:complete len:139 (+),score=10.35 TRINITY_DN2445_c0_g1_i2:132-548(+)